MKVKSSLLYILCCLIFVGCCTLRPAVLSSYSSLQGYRYAYITPTGDKIGGAGATFGGKYGVYGSSSTKSTNPAEIISGYLIKKGFIISPDINNGFIDKTVIINYGETGRRTCGLGYSIEITLQILDARNREVICVCSAEGRGETEADDIRIAITRCLDKVFE